MAVSRFPRKRRAILAGFLVCALMIVGGSYALANANAEKAGCVPGAFVLIPTVAMNVGGPALTAGGRTWSADQYGTGGHVWASSATADVANTDLDPLFRSERAAKHFTYNIPVPNGSYVVRLHMAEIYWKAPGGAPVSAKPGKRLETFTIEGGFSELRGFDPAVVARGALKASTAGYQTQVTDGVLTIEGDGHTDFAALQALEALHLKICAADGQQLTEPTSSPSAISTPPDAAPQTPAPRESSQPSPSAAPINGEQASSSGVFRPAAIPVSGAEVPNSGRGMFEWLTIPSLIPNYPMTDMYYRDQLQWGQDIEESQGNYDFSALEAALQKAKARGGRLHFRIMAYCPGCGDNLTPAYVPRQANGWPDWNSEGFLSAWERLFKAMGAKYANDPRIATIDVGGYGAWGEWFYAPEYGAEISSANETRLIRAVTTGFPNKHVLINLMGLEQVNNAVQVSPKIGFRFDCLGGMETDLQYQPLLKDVWKRSPVVTEWCPTAPTTATQGVANVKALHVSLISSSNYPRKYAEMSVQEKADFALAYKQAGFRYSLSELALPANPQAGSQVSIRTTWNNAGVAPTYDKWAVDMLLSDASGTIAWETTLSDNLQQLAEGSASFTTTPTLPTTLKGNYRVSVVVRDPSGYLKPMRLATQGQTTDGTLPLGVITIK